MVTVTRESQLELCHQNSAWKFQGSIKHPWFGFLYTSFLTRRTTVLGAWTQVFWHHFFLVGQGVSLSSRISTFALSSKGRSKHCRDAPVEMKGITSVNVIDL